MITLLETDLDISYAIRAGVKHRKYTDQYNPSLVIATANLNGLIFIVGATAANRDRSKVDSCGRLVTFDVFHKDYWPHLPQYLTNKLGKSYCSVI